jgi:hypothetical protein
MPSNGNERKRAANLAKHGVDFELAKLIFDGPTLEGQTSDGTMANGASARTARPRASCFSLSIDCMPDWARPP